MGRRRSRGGGGLNYILTSDFSILMEKMGNVISGKNAKHAKEQLSEAHQKEETQHNADMAELDRRISEVKAKIAKLEKEKAQGQD